MILTTCAACAAPLAHDAPRCIRCHTRYCDATCQHRETPFPLVISVAGLQGDEVNFKVNPTTRLQRIFDAYADRKGIALASFRFLFKGSCVDGKLTCADIGLEDGDQLEAENAQDAVAARDE